MATRYCCCGSNLNAAKILAAIFIVIRVIQISVQAYVVANWDVIEDLIDTEGLDSEELQEAIDQVELVFKAGLGLNVVFVAADIGLLIGSIKKITILLWLWIGLSACGAIYMVVQGVLVFNIVIIIPTALAVLVSLWTMAAVYGAIKEIKEEQ